MDDRWKALILGLSKRGYLKLYPKSMADIIAKIKAKDEKQRQMRILGRWRVLINGVVGENVELSQVTLSSLKQLISDSNSDTQLVKNIAALDEVVKELRQQIEKRRQLRVNGRWRKLTNKLLACSVEVAV